MGHANPEGQKSGAFWFYYKLGFRPAAPRILTLVRNELARLAAHPRERSSAATLNRLAAEYVFLHTARPRGDVLGRVSLGNIGLRISRLLAARAGAERERGVRDCASDAARLLGVRRFDSWSAGRAARVGTVEPARARDPRRGSLARGRPAGARGRYPRQGRPPRVGLRPALRRHRRLRRGVLELASDEPTP